MALKTEPYLRAEITANNCVLCNHNKIKS